MTDHRINLTLHKIDRVMEGVGLDEIIDQLIAEDQASATGGHAEAMGPDPLDTVREAGRTRLGLRRWAGVWAAAARRLAVLDAHSG